MELIHLPELPLRMETRKAGMRMKSRVDATVRCPADGVTFTVPVYQEHEALITTSGYTRDTISAETPVPIALEHDNLGNIRLKGVEQLDGEFVLLRDFERKQRRVAHGV